MEKLSAQQQDYLSKLLLENEQQAAEIGRLRAALKPFAAADVDGIISLDEVSLSPEDFKGARDAYEQDVSK